MPAEYKLEIRMTVMNGIKADSKIEQSLLNFLKIGILLYVAGFFLFRSSTQNTLLYLTTFLPWLLLLPYTLKHLLSKHILVKMLVVGLFYYCISSFWSSSPGEAFPKLMKYSVYIFAYMTAIFLLVKSNKLSINHVFKVIFFSAIASGVITLIEQWPIINNARLTHSTLMTISSNPINTAVFFSVASLIAIHFIRITEKVNYQIISLIALLLFIGLILLTKSRGPVIALMLVIPLMFITIKSKSKLVDYVLISIMVILVLVVTIVLSEQAIGRLNEPNYRLEIWSAAFEMIRENLLLGTGLNYDERIITSSGLVFTHAHNSFIQFIVTGGLIGGGIFASIIISALVIGYKSQDSAVRFCVIWLLFGCLCLSTNGKLLIYRPSSVWFSFWGPLSLIFGAHVTSLDGSKYDYFSKLKHHLRWQKGYSRSRWALNLIAGLWMSFWAWLVSKSERQIKKEPCDVLIFSRREKDIVNHQLISLLSENYIVKTAFQAKRPKIIKKRFVAKVPWLVPASQYIYASFAWYIVSKYQPKIVMTTANGSALSPFLRAAVNESGGSIVHIPHSIPANRYRSFSLLDADYYLVYGKSSIEKLKKREKLFGEAKCIETGSWQLESRLDTTQNIVDFRQEKAILLLGSGPGIERYENTKKIYKLTIGWVLGHPEYKLYFKPHPRSNGELWNTLVADIDDDKFEKIDKLGSHLSHCKIAVAAYTNAILDASLIGIPPLWFATKDETDEFSYETFFGQRSSDSEQLVEKFADYVNKADFYKEKTVSFAKYHIHQPEQGATKYIAEIIEKILLGKGDEIAGELVKGVQVK